MTKRRSSLKGRGSEILFGGPATVEIEPRGSALVLDEEMPPEPDPIDEEVLVDLLTDEEGESLSPSEAPGEEEPTLPPDAEEFEQSLREEALDGELGPGEEEDLSLVDDQPPPTQEMEAAFLEEALGAEEPPEPVTEAPAPPPEETMEEIDLSEDEALDEPPPPETDDVSTGVLPPRPDGIYLDEAEPLSAYDVQDSEEVIDWLELPDRDLTPDEERILLRRYGSARLKQLDKEITKTYNQVTSELGENEDLATDCYNQLLKARDIVLRRQASKIPQAEYYVEQAQARLRRASKSKSGAQKYAWWITGWGFVWGTVFLAALIALGLLEITPSDANASASVIALDVEVEIFLSAMIWGGIGGVVAVWYSLFKHVGRRDFDTQYNLTYVGKPFLGLFLGAIIWMIFNLLLILGILPAGLQTGDGTNFIGVTPWIMYPLAFACGFKENRLLDLVDRVIKRVFSGEKESEPEPASDTDVPVA